jgi:hypothetical protein
MAANRFPAVSPIILRIQPSLVDELLQSSDCRNAAIRFLREVHLLSELLDDLQVVSKSSDSLALFKPLYERFR